MFSEIPAKGFVKISGTRNPPDDGTEYMIQLRTGFCDLQHRYTAKQLIWIHDGGPGDIMAIKKV